MNKVCLIMAGGTGGHVFPGLAVADALVKKGWHVEWLGTAERMEAKVVPAHGYPIHFIPVKGIRGKGMSSKIKGLFGALKALMMAIRTVRSIQPDLVIGMGGYASGPGGIAAWLLNKPLVLHEQNAAAGLTNRILGRFAKKILLGFEQAKSSFSYKLTDCVYVGNPVRNDIASLPTKTAVSEPINLLVIGGSLGAKVLNEVLPEASRSVHEVNIWHQCGEGNSDRVAASYGERHGELKVTDFIEDMASAYQWADIVVCRAGALTVAEVSAAGLAAIFVPLPHAVDDHQTKNAMFLAESGAARIVKQNDLQSQLEANIAELVSDPHLCLDMGNKAKQIALVNATQDVVVQCETLIGVAA